MTNPYANPDNFAFIDFETKALPGSGRSGDLTIAGSYRYAKHSFAILLSHAVGRGAIGCVEVRDFEHGAMQWKNVPDSLKRHHDRVMAGTAWYGAWNMGFDWNIWNEATYDFPPIGPEHTVDFMYQATSSNLAAKLEGASKNINRDGKQPDGKALIQLFCSEGLKATPQSHPDKWARFVSYAKQDIEEMREVYLSTRALDAEDWHDHRVSERINARGMALDIAFISRCARIAELNARVTNDKLARWTNGQITAVTQVPRLGPWLYDAIETSEARELLVKEYNAEATTEDGDEADVKVAKLSLKKDRLDALLAYYKTLAEQRQLTEREQLIVNVAEARLFGASTSPLKFDKMLDMHDEGVLKGQYVNGGAQQTDRFSSRGVQIHNLTRSALPGRTEIEAIEMINQLEDN